MPDNFLTFQKFNDIALANKIAGLFKQNHIDYFLEDTRKYFDVSFANNSVDPDISIKIKAEDFSEAHRVLEHYFKAQISTVDEDYYLFDFTNEELLEIVSKPDEWGYFDYQLAQEILKERGKKMNPEVVSLLKTKRMEELAEPEAAEKYWIYLGYLIAVLAVYSVLQSEESLLSSKKRFLMDEEYLLIMKNPENTENEYSSCRS